MAAPPDGLVLIDGSSLAYRAFHALPESIATSKGEPTNAILGMAQMLTKLMSDRGVGPTVVAWDAGHSGRRDHYPEYKATRASRPDLLREQWPQLAPLCEALGHVNAVLEGFEADDVIATLAERASGSGIPVTIVTGDRDALQLVGDGVTVLATGRGITETKIYDRAAVIERYGVPPELIPDLIGLKGDSSDNLPGVPGIGEKTAAALLQEFGSLEGVLEHVDEVKGPKRQQNLRDHADVARMCRELATAKRDLPVDLDPAEVPSGEPDPELLRETFMRWELREPLRRLEEALGDRLPESAGDGSGIEPAVQEGDLKAVAGFAGNAALAVAVAVPEAPDGALFADEEEAVFAVSADGQLVIEGTLSDPSLLASALGERPVLAHDAKALGAVPANIAHDTMIAGHLLDPARRGYPLAELAAEQGIEVVADSPAAADAVRIHELAAVQSARLAELGLDRLFHEIELPAIPVLREMEEAGILLDTARLAEIADRVRAEVAELESAIHEQAGGEFTVGSPQQLGAVLFEKLGLTRKRKGKTGYSTDARVLQSIRDEHPIVPLVERWRETTKLVSTYLDALPRLVDPSDGRIHTTFHQAATATGRLSSTDPNLQNIPVRTELGREIRSCFVAGEGCRLVSCDYSQVELRILAHLSGDEALKRIFKAGDDVHSATAAEIFGIEPGAVDTGLRAKAKMVNYGIVYGLSAFGLADRLDIPQAEAQEFIDRYFEGFPGLATFMSSAVSEAADRGWATTIAGRRRPIPELRARNRQVRQLGERLAVNTVVQGTAADVMKVGMVRCSRMLVEAGLDARLLLQVHDELLLEAPAAEADDARQIAVEAMEGAWELEPPLVVDSGVGDDWLSVK